MWTKKRWLRVVIPVVISLFVAGSTFFVLSNKVSVAANKGIIAIGIARSNAPPIGEVVEKRTANSKTTYLGNGRYSIDTRIGAIHYKDTVSAWQAIDNTIVGGVMDKADYTFRLLQNTFNAGQIVEFSRGGQYIRLQPMALEWSNNLAQISQVSMPQAVAGTVTNTPVQLSPGVNSNRGEINWTGAYGVGRNFKWITRPTRLMKLLTISSLANLPAPPANIIAGGNPFLRLNMIFAPSSGLNIYVDGVLWTRQANSQVQSFGRIEFRNAAGETLWDFAPLLYWDSEGNQGESIKTVRRAGNNLYIEVRVPYSWLQTAVYPVNIDTTIDVSVAASTDDTSIYWNVSTWERNNIGAGQGVGYQTTFTKRGGGMRFLNLNIPNAATIGVAYLTFIALSDSSGTTVNSVIIGEKTQAPATFGTLANYQARRGTIVGGADDTQITSASVTWNSIPAWTGSSSYNSPSIITIVQEIVNLAGWVGDGTDDIVLFWDDHAGAGTQSANINRFGASWDNTSLNPPALHIEYTSLPSITVSPTTYDFGTVTESSTTNTTTTYFTIDNTSTMQTDQTISVTTANWTSAGVPWVHSDNATAGVDTAGLKANKAGTWGTGDIIIKYNATWNDIATNQAANTDYQFGLSLIAPSSFTDGVQKTIIVRVTAASG